MAISEISEYGLERTKREQLNVCSAEDLLSESKRLEGCRRPAVRLRGSSQSCCQQGIEPWSPVLCGVCSELRASCLGLAGVVLQYFLAGFNLDLYNSHSFICTHVRLRPTSRRHAEMLATTLAASLTSILAKASI